MPNKEQPPILLSKYQKMIDSGKYMDEEELCNGEGLNYDDIFRQPRGK